MPIGPAKHGQDRVHDPVVPRTQREQDARGRRSNEDRLGSAASDYGDDWMSDALVRDREPSAEKRPADEPSADVGD